ncbi:FeoB-associated Cys-rich membrane protein [Sporosalibacterium faouarense]|uniref:FeoB-associated Cys-rich membrane protein n=1 Tax=Sporosalibacterium faouarense TaxID=516123 RepID=UPI00141CFAF6|nr:FeoB-associated Cys-rich membrane protein [Sporosalibacterium faouarense]MTI47158.1 FeoB-associated Cys-rich membrane protein [Bacillota bacterium]
MSNIIVILVILAIVGIAIRKIVVEKRNGAKCIGCPAGKTGKSDCNCSTTK